MTPTAGPGPDKGCTAAALTRPARQVHLAVLTAFAQTGHAPGRGELERIARAGGADPAAVRAELAGHDVLAFGQAGEIRAAYPFSPSPTPIQVTWEDGPVTYATCALDALGISAMLGRPVTITAAEPGTGRIITVHAGRHQARWNPPRTVVFAGTTGRDCPHAADRTCGHIHFFTTAQAARTWAHATPTITGTVLRQAQALRRGAAEFGAIMQTADRTARPCPDPTTASAGRAPGAPTMPSRSAKARPAWRR